MSIIYRPAQGYGLTVIYCCQFPFYQPDGFVQKNTITPTTTTTKKWIKQIIKKYDFAIFGFLSEMEYWMFLEYFCEKFLIYFFFPTYKFLWITINRFIIVFNVENILLKISVLMFL